MLFVTLIFKLHAVLVFQRWAFTFLVVTSIAVKRSYAAYVECFIFSSISDCTTNGNCAIITHPSYLVWSFKGSFNRWVDSSTCVTCLYKGRKSPIVSSYLRTSTFCAGLYSIPLCELFSFPYRFSINRGIRDTDRFHGNKRDRSQSNESLREQPCRKQMATRH